MGIKGLTKEIKKLSPSAIKTMTYEELAAESKHKTYGVDVFAYLYSTQYNVVNKSKGNHIREFLEMIVTWASHGIRLIFVFDGDTRSDAKGSTNDERHDKRIAAQENIRSLISSMSTDIDPGTDTDIDLNMLGKQLLDRGEGTAEQRIELEFALRHNIVVTEDKVYDIMALLDLVGATYIQARGEADFILAGLYKGGFIDGVMSEDCDMLTHGIDRLVRGVWSMRRNSNVTVYSLSTILDDTGLTMSQFIDYCILCGCDYCPKISGVAGGVGLRLLKKHGSISSIIELMNNDKISYRPADVTCKDYEMQYRRAYSVFSCQQEPLPDFKLGNYVVGEGLTEWILDQTNYTAGTLAGKLEVLTGRNWDPVIKQKIQIKAKLK
jgi:flap endonuclease-1